MRDFMRNGHGSAVSWFALSAAVLSIAAMASAQSLNWLSHSGHLALVAYRSAPDAPAGGAGSDAGIDRTPTGSIQRSALMLRIR